MQTWLDYHIDQLIDTWQALVSHDGPVPQVNGPEIAHDIQAYAKTKKNPGFTDKLDIARRLVYRLALQSNQDSFRLKSVELASKKLKNGSQAWSWIIETACCADLLPFLGRGPGAPGWPQLFSGRTDIKVEAATAIKPDKALIGSLINAAPPADPEGRFEQALLAGGSWYIDFPARSLPLGDGNLRAVFMVPAMERGYRVCAIVTMPDSDKLKGRVMWSLGAPADCYGFMASGVDMAKAAEQVNDLIRLLILYRATAPQPGASLLPRMDPAKLDVSPRRIHQNRKKTTLFSVERMAAPADLFGRKPQDTDTAAGWTLGWRSSVSGHFKLQAHGPASSLRKLIWVDGYSRGPEDGPRKVQLERLSGKSLDRT